MSLKIISGKIILKFLQSLDVSFRVFAASLENSVFRHNIEAQPSGEITEYTEY